MVSTSFYFEKKKDEVFNRVNYGGSMRYMPARDLKTIQHLINTPWHIRTEAQITDGTSKNELAEIVDSLKGLKLNSPRDGKKSKGLGLVHPDAQWVVEAVPKKNRVTAQAPFGYV